MKDILITLLVVLVGFLCWGISTGEIKTVSEATELAVESSLSCVVNQDGRLCHETNVRTWIELQALPIQ